MGEGNGGAEEGCWEGVKKRDLGGREGESRE